LHVESLTFVKKLPLPSRLSFHINHYLESPQRVHQVLAGSILLLAIHLSLFFVLQADQLRSASFEKSVKKEMSQQIQQKHGANNQLKREIKKLGFFNFSRLTQPGESQYVFKEGNLVFWGDNHFFPEYSRIKNEQAEKYIELKSGKFLVIKDTLTFKGEQFEVINLLPLFYSYDIENRYINPGPNTAIFSDNAVVINNYQIAGDVAISSTKGDYLFSVHPPSDFKSSIGWLNFATLFSIGVFLCALTVFVWFWAQRLHLVLARSKVSFSVLGFFKRNKADYLLAVLLLYTIGVRFLLLFFQLPHSILHIRFFNAHYYHWGALTPSPGDLLLHLAFAVLYLLAVKHLLRKTWLFGWITGTRSDDKFFCHLVKAGILFLSHACLYGVAGIVSLMFDTLKYSLDILELPLWDVSVVLTFFLVVLVSALFWGLTRMGYELMNKTIRNGLVFQYAPALFLFLVSTFALSWHIGIVVAILHVLLYGTAFLLRIPSGKHSFDYAILVFFTLSAICCAAIATVALASLYPKRDLEMKTNFLSQQLVENNLLGENLLNDISKQVVSDPYVANTLQNPTLAAKDIEEKVRRFYLGNYLNRYDIQVLAFDLEGLAMSEYDKRTLNEVRYQYPYKLYKTNYPDIFYYVTQQNQLLKNYLSVVPIFQIGKKTGTILIDMQPKKFIPNSILPVLLVEKKGENLPNTNKYSYAVFNQGEMTNSFGNFNFRKELVTELLRDSVLYNSNRSLNDGFFLVSDLGKGRKIIVQSDKQALWEMVCNFSFLFILMELAITLFFAGNLLVFNFDRFYNSLTFKIQLYSVLAFFIPIGLVSSGVLIAVITSYNQELKIRFKDNAATIAYSLSEDLQKFYQREKDIDKLNESVLRIARLYNTDINIYRKSGLLLVSSSPILFKTGLISTLIAPNAYYAIRQEKNKLFLQEETIGKLHYNHVYVQVRSSETGEELGIISIPFFASGQELSDRVINTLKIILNISTLTFMVFLFFSFMASNFITYPLKLITHRIRKTTLESSNRPLNWESKDELGLLIREYNLMLQKLEQNKQSLAVTQKESAWREVAQQVAHEIKNPLTPIKLSLQHMRRVFLSGQELRLDKIDKTFDTIIQQVEVLDEIASSFSIYAKMPTYTLTEVDLQKVILQMLDVYASDKREYIHSDFPLIPSLALADERMLGRILANLLLNAFQAVPNNRTPAVQIHLIQESETFLLSIVDNGVGISSELEAKVFEPHFSTKFSGSGIGLYIAKKGIEQMGGEIGFENNVDKGTTFWIRLKSSIKYQVSSVG
jgi:signal transduction histidine kinase